MTNVDKCGAVAVSSRYSGARRWIERLLLAVGLGLSLVYLAAWIHAQVMSRASLWSFDALQSTPSMAEEQKDQTPGDGLAFSLWSGKRASAYTRALAGKLGAPMAVLSIRRLGLEVPVFDGTDRITLNRGAGRILGTAQPGEQGNIGISAHRDGFFRGLKDLQVGDQIELAVPAQKFVYTVDNIEVVNASDTSVLRPRDRPSLTLVTCYPFYFIGTAPERYVAQASLTNTERQGSDLAPRLSNINYKEKNNEFTK
jgi:sortase A